MIKFFFFKKNKGFKRNICPIEFFFIPGLKITLTFVNLYFHFIIMFVI